MRLDDVQGSGNVEDRRGMGGKLAIGGGGGVLLLILGLIFGVDFGGGNPRQAANPGAPPDPKTKEFPGKVMFTLEKVWEGEFEKHHREYGARWRAPKLVLFSDAVDTGALESIRSAADLAPVVFGVKAT